MPKFRKNRNKGISGFALKWQSKTSSSKRTVAAANLIDEIRKAEVQKGTKKARRYSKKEHKLSHMVEIQANKSKSVSPEEACGMTFGPNLNLDIYMSDTAAVHWGTGGKEEVFTVMVIPRESTLQKVNPKNTAATVRALQKLQQTEKSCKRSEGKTGTSTTNARYPIFGRKINRGGHGFVHDKLSEADPEAARTLERFARRMEQLAAEYLPSRLLRAICKANGSGAWETLAKSVFVAAVASSVNYSAPAHVDDDFLFLIHQLNVDSNGSLDSNEVVQFFCFPTLGFAIGLRPGDVILFNPHVHHCLSEKTKCYSDVDVHVTTFYVKTAHVGKNDNTVPLTEQEQLYYNMNLK